MIIVFNCPGCGAILRMKEQYGGQRGRCPHCQGAITVPAIETDAGMDLLPLDATKAGSPAEKTEAENAAPSQTPPGSFSLGSRFASLPSSKSHEAKAGEAKGAAPGADSNIGLAPLEEGAAKPTVASPSAPKPVSKPAMDSAIGLAPLEEPPRAKPAAAAPAAAKSSAAPSEEFSLAPLDASAEAAKTSPRPTAGKPSSTEAAATAPVKADDRFTCGKCGAKMRLPANAAGKSVVCPKCKNKQRVPDGFGTTPLPAGKSAPPKQSNSDTISLSDTPPAGADLGDGMLDMLGEGTLPADSTAPETSSAAALGAPKLSGGKAKSGTIFGLPALAVYGGAAAVALIFALGLVFLLSGPSGSGPTVAQAPAAAPGVSPPAASTAPTNGGNSPAAANSSPPPASGGLSSLAPPAPAPTPAPTNTAPPAAANAPSPGGLAALRSKMASPANGQAPDGQPAAETPPAAAAPAPAVTPAAPTASDPANWRARIPAVRMADAQPMPGDNVAPASDQNEASGLLQELRNSQQAQVDLLSQITSPESAKSVAPKWADVLAEGLDRTKRLRLAGGPPKPGSRPTGGGLAAAARAAAAEKPDTEEVAQIDAGLQRAGAIEGVAPILEAALAERASREPQGALAEALIKRGVSIPGAGQ